MIKIKNTQIINIINNFLNRRFSEIALGLAVIIFVLGCAFLIFPKYKEIKETAQLTGERESAEYIERYKYYNQLEELNREYEKIKQDDIDKIKIMAPEEKYQEELLAFLEEFVLKNGLLLTSANVEEMGLTADGINKLVVNLNVAGADYNSFKKLLDEIESNLRILDVNSLSFAPESQTASFNITAYYFK